MAVQSFLFGGDTQETPDSIKRKREIVRALMAAQGAPRNVGEGLNALGDGIVSAVLDSRANKAEKEGIASANSAFAPIAEMFGGSPSSSPLPNSGAGAEMRATDPAKTPIFANDGTELGSYLSDETRRATLPAGMRNNNPGNIKFVGQKVPGIVGPSVNTDQGDPQAVFDTPESGMKAMYSLLGKKYAGGKLTPNQMIAGNMGWTPGNFDAAKNVARTMGIGPDDDIGFSDPQRAAKFMQALILQEHGQKGQLYPESLITSAIGGRPAQPAQVASLDPAAGMPAAPQAYVDPMVSAPNAQPQQTAALPQGAPAQTPAASPRTQVAQALSANQAQQGQVDTRAIMNALSNPFLSPGQRAVGEALLRQETGRRQAILEQQLKQQDPQYRQELEKGGLEIENLRNPRIGPADQARIDLEQQKLDFDRNGISAADKAKMDFDREKFEAEKEKGQWEKLTDGRLYNKTKGEFRDAPPPVPGSIPPKFDDISGLRKEIHQLPSYKNMSQALPIYRSMAETAGRNTKASDLNLVYGLGKIMDPTSVVREGEMVMVKNTASLPDWLQGAIASLNGGAALTPETRQAIMTEAHGRVQGYDQAFKQDAGQYSGIVQRNNFNPSDVIPDFGTYEPWKMPAAAKEATGKKDNSIPPPPDGIDPEDWKFMDEGQRKLFR